ncbi:peptide deformylase [Arthrobacter silvisoli]|uniref:peptide deformylase n=1 Tax=Arthrobacter silvisoli TaxID=2291022 RepID=UPI000E21820C|nr:peptide deformylase [Arthrobacter silvisoli]
MAAMSETQHALVFCGDSALRLPVNEIPPRDLRAGRFRDLFETMTTVMRQTGAVGIAAPQIGVSSNVAVIEDHTVRDDAHLQNKHLKRVDLTIMVNPCITHRSKETATHFEGCLSTPGYQAAVRRHLSIDVSWLDQQGIAQESTFTGWPARIVQHEIAHLQGRTIFEDCVEGGIVHEIALRSVWSVRGVDAFLKSTITTARSDKSSCW